MNVPALPAHSNGQNLQVTASYRWPSLLGAQLQLGLMQGHQPLLQSSSFNA